MLLFPASLDTRSWTRACRSQKASTSRGNALASACAIALPMATGIGNALLRLKGVARHSFVVLLSTTVYKLGTIGGAVVAGVL